MKKTGGCENTGKVTDKVKIALLEEEVAALKAETEALKEFKRKVELGSRWLWCAFYVLGGTLLFGYQTYEFFLKHFAFKTP